MNILAASLIALGSFVAIGNLVGCVRAYLRRRRGQSGGFSSIPLLSLLFCVLAWLLSQDRLLPWVFLPVILDPANWSLVALPVFLLVRSRDHNRSVEHSWRAKSGPVTVSPKEVHERLSKRAFVRRLLPLASELLQDRFIQHATADEYYVPDDLVDRAVSVAEFIRRGEGWIESIHPAQMAAAQSFANVALALPDLDLLGENPQAMITHPSWRELRDSAADLLTQLGYEISELESDPDYR